MDTRSSVWLMRGPVVFSTPDGQAIEGAADRIELFFEDGALSVCDLTFHISAEAYGRVSAQELFQLAASVRGPGSGTFRPKGMVTIEARLANQFLPLISTGSEEAEVAAQALQSAPAGSPLRSAQSWYALHVTEEVELPEGLEGTLLSGYSTTWSDGDDDAAADTSLLGIVTAYLQQEEWDFVAMPGKPGVAFRFAGTNLEWDCFVVADEDTGMVLMYSISPKRVPAKRRAAAAEYITRANWGIPSGNFEMDYQDGDVRFKTGIDIDAGEFTANLFDHIAEANIVGMNTYIGGLLAVIQGKEPTLALAQAEAEAAAAD